MTPAAKWEAIRAAAEGRNAPAGMFHYTMSAAVNADDTAEEEPGEDWSVVALRSLEGLLADGLDAETDKAARAYFADLGVHF